MKFKSIIEKDFSIPVEIMEEKVVEYLKKNFYRVIEKGTDYVIFIEDEYSDRKRYRSDFRNRIGEGKFSYNSIGQEAHLKLIYFTPVLYPIFIFMLFAAAGVYVRSVVPSLFGSAVFLPIIVRIVNLRIAVFEEISSMLSS